MTMVFVNTSQSKSVTHRTAEIDTLALELNRYVRNQCVSKQTKLNFRKCDEMNVFSFITISRLFCFRPMCDPCTNKLHVRKRWFDKRKMNVSMIEPVHLSVFQHQSFNVRNKILNERFEDKHTNKFQQDILLKMEKFFKREKFGCIVIRKRTDRTTVLNLLPYVLGAKRIIVITSCVDMSNITRESFFGNGKDCYVIRNGILDDSLEASRSFWIPGMVVKPNNVQTFCDSPALFVNIRTEKRDDECLSKRVRVEEIVTTGNDLVIIPDADVFDYTVRQDVVDHFSRGENRLLFMYHTWTPTFNGKAPFSGNMNIF